MKIQTATIALTVLIGLSVLAENQTNDQSVPSSDGSTPLRQVDFSKIHLSDPFWAPRIKTNSEVTIPHCFKACETRISNFRRAAKLEEGHFRGDPFDDSDVFKVIEGAAYNYKGNPDSISLKQLNDLIAVVTKAQEADGYLYTARTIEGEKAPGRASNVRFLNEMGGVNGGDSHELYNMGHMIEAAVAHYYATGSRDFLNIAIKTADLIDQTWGPGAGQLKISPGHQEIELALVKLGLATGDQKYIKLSKFLLDCRGHYRRPAGVHVEMNDRYYANEVPLAQLTEAVGHSVRTAYMLSGMTDIATLLGVDGFKKACDAIWQDTVGTKIYLHGGLGSGVGMAEGFGEAYQLPNKGYSETCAAIANVFWNHRMFLLHRNSKYLDVMERSLFNNVLSGISLSGNQFFYQNPLISTGGYGRVPWFGCPCCPTNLARAIPSVPGLMYATRGNELFVALYAAGKAELNIAGEKIEIVQATEYPWDGKIQLQLTPEKATTFALKLRIPGWAVGTPIPGDLYRYLGDAKTAPKLKVNGVDTALKMENGFAVLSREWKAGDTVELDLPMEIRRVLANDKVEANHGRVALERGPLVYCLEGIDNGGTIFNLLLPDNAELSVLRRPDLLNGVNVLSVNALSLRKQTDGTVQSTAVTVTAIPYYAWCNRGAGSMQVWLPREEKATQPLAAPSVANQSKVSASINHDSLNAVNDDLKPKNSNDHSLPRMTWWDHKGSAEWIQYDFEKTASVNGIKIWWFDDRAGNGGCRVPEKCVIEYFDGTNWKPVANQSAGGCDLDRENVISFDAVQSTGLRLQVKLQKGFSGGILEWEITTSTDK